MKDNIKLYWLLPIRVILFILAFTLVSFLTNQNLSSLTHWWSIIASVMNIIVIFILIRHTHINKINYLELIKYKRGSKRSTIFIVSSVMIIMGMGGMYLSGIICYGQFPYLAPMMIAPIPLVLAIINIIVLPITTTLAEDGLYLGCGVNQIKSKWVAIIVPAFFYALQHSFIPTLFDMQFIIYRFLSFLPLTIMICYWYYHKQNTLPIMIGHTLLNIATVLQIFIMSLKPELYIQLLSL